MGSTAVCRSECWLENGLPVRATTPLHMMTVTSFRCPIRPWRISILKTVIIILVGGFLAVQPTSFTNASDISVDDLAVRSTKLEAAGQWPELVSLCETAARKGELSNELYQRYDLAKIHCDLDRRSAEKAYQEALQHITEGEARQLFIECLGRINSHHVTNPDFHKLISRGCLALQVAISDPRFQSVHARQATPDRIALFQRHIQQIIEGRSIASLTDAETVAIWIVRAAQSVVGIPPAVTFLEMTAASVGGLDEYSAFLTTGQLNDLYAQIEGNFVGLGVELKSAKDGLLVVHVISGSPAERSGLKAGDHLIGIAGKPIAGMHVDAAAQMLQGPEGSRVTLAVLRGVGPARAMTVRREHVEIPSIEDVELLDRLNGIGYLHITSFQKKTAADLDTAMRQLDASGMRSLIIDLRGNPGGLLSAAVDVSDLFIDRGLVVATRGRSPEEDFNYTASHSGTWHMPLTLLIDGDSASSSEIFAGAIRDHNRGKIIGSRSYGKGSIQGIFPMDVAGVGMRLTTAHFYSPTGQPYSRVGVSPDLWVQQTARPDGTGQIIKNDATLATALNEVRKTLEPVVSQPVARRITAR
jgi:carboxyl-terminal processing protease